MSKKFEYEIRQVDALPTYIPSKARREYRYKPDWYYNESFYLGIMETNSKDVKRAFTNWLNRKGIKQKHGTTYVEDIGGTYILRLRKTDEPLFDCTPLF